MAQLEIAIKALEKIRNTQGKVCEMYEICEHVSCSSSYASWAIADEALRHLTPFAQGEKMIDEIEVYVCDEDGLVLLTDGRDTHVCMQCEKPMNLAKFVRPPTPRELDDAANVCPECGEPFDFCAMGHYDVAKAPRQ